MNPGTFREAEALVSGVSKFAAKTKNVDVILCPPSVWLTDFSHKVTKGVAWGSQNVFWEDPPAGGGPFTGEVSASMLKNSGVRYVIIGHSERRKWLGETDEMINKKVRASLKAGLRVILCVGEPASVRKKGIADVKSFVKSQLTKDLAGTKSYKLKANSLIVAYEPIWAIGTGKADKPEEAAEMTRFIGSWFMVHGLKCRVLYGGSVTSVNIKRFIQYKEIDGALVGGASLKVAEFNNIIKLSS